MIRVSVLYATGDGKTFDHDYYVNKHMVLVRERLGDLGLRRLEVDRGIAGGAPGRRPTRARGTCTSTPSRRSGRR